MTQVDTSAGAPVAPDVAPATPAPTPAPAVDATASAGAGGPQPTGGEEFMQVQREPFKPYGYDYHDVIRRAKTHDENAEWFPRIQELKDMGINTAEEFKQYWNTMHAKDGEPVIGEQTPPATPPAPENPDAKTMTVGDYKKLQKEFADEQRTASETAEQARVTTEAQAAETQFVSGLLDEMKLPADSPQRGPMGALADFAITQAIEKRVVPTLATYLTPEQRAEEIRQCKTLATTPEDLKAAREIFSNVVKDFENEGASRVALATQDATPSLAGGPGGPQAPNDISKLSLPEYDALGDKRRDAEKAEFDRLKKAGGRQ